MTTTDNRIEILAAIYGLESIIDNIASQKIKLDQIDFFTTSKYLYNAVSLGWIYKWKSNNWMKTEWNGLPPQPIKNSDLWKELIDCEEKLKQLGVNLILHYVPESLAPGYRRECVDRAYQLAQNAALEALTVKEKYEAELFSKECEEALSYLYLD